MTSQEFKISPSQLATFKSCSQKWAYSYGEGLKRKGQSTLPLDVGLYVHELCHFLNQLIKSGFKHDSDTVRLSMKNKMARDLEEASIKNIEVYTHGQLAFWRYFNLQAPLIDTDIAMLEVEHELVLPLENLEFHGMAITFHGFVDLIYLTMKKKVVIRDYKTGQRRDSHSESKMEVQDQLLFYATLWYKLTGQVPAIEIVWINTKMDYKKEPSHDQLFGVYYYEPSAEYLEGFWNYLLDMVQHMRTTKVIKNIGTFCTSCAYLELCVLNMRGVDTTVYKNSTFIKVDREQNYVKFTEAHARDNSENKGGTINFIRHGFSIGSNS